MSKQTVNFRSIGKISYADAWDLQEKLLAENVSIKLQSDRNTPSEEVPTANHLLFCEHPHVYTLGKSGKPEHLLIDEAARKELEIEYYKINRGGDITYHGPGQLVGYPILDLEKLKPDLSWYLRSLEEVVIRVIAHFGIAGDRLPGATGVWLEPESTKARKICAMGIRCSRWITMHGFALNVNTDLSYFDYIVPCGIDDKAVTSIQAETGYPVDMNEVQKLWIGYFEEVFSVTVK